MKVYNDIKNVSTEFVKNNLSKKDNKSGKSSELNTEDSVEFSSEINNLKELGNKSAGFSNIRQGKVNGIKLQVEEGLYKISSKDIADRIIEEQIIK